MRPRPFLFEPWQLPREVLEATLVGRQPVVDRLLRDIVDDADHHRDRHWLVSGPGGCGKTHLIKIVSRRLEERGWLVASLGGEHHLVSNLADLLERIVERFAEGRSPFASEVSLQRVEDLSVDWLRQRRKRDKLLLVVENLGDLLMQLSQRDQLRLREILMRDAPFTLLGTSRGPVEATTHHDAPFYDFFHPIVLDTLGRDAIRALMQAWLSLETRQDVVAVRHEVLARTDALYHFSGGNPRLVLSFYEILRDGVDAPLCDQMYSLLDHVTPYYQSLFQDISPQMARVLAEMSIASGPLTPSEIARRTRLATNQVTANITRLVDARLITATGRPDKRRRYYEIVDRLFRTWLALRANPSQGKPFEDLCMFFESWYRRTRSDLPSFVHEPGPEVGYGAGGQEHAPWAASRRVAEADDREAALAALHPEEREAVAMILRS